MKEFENKREALRWILLNANGPVTTLVTFDTIIGFCEEIEIDPDNCNWNHILQIIYSK
jgi:hypothetical protein